jgi:hypothetical protein
VAWAPDYITVAQAGAFLRIADTVDDVELGNWVTAASRAIDDRCNRQFGQDVAPVARTYRRTPYADPTTGLWILEIDDIQTTVGLLVNGVAYASSGAVLLPDNAPADGVPWQQLGFVTMPYPSYPGVPQLNVITGRFGWTAFPTQVIGASKLQVSRWNARRDSPFGVAGGPGAELRLLARLDPDVSTSLVGLSRRRRVG